MNTTDKQFTAGLIETPKDERDIPFELGKVVKQISIDEVPMEDWDYSSFTLIKNQKDTDQCGGYSSAAVSEDQEKVPLCPAFSFAAAKYIQGGDIDSYGTDLRSIGQAHRKIGALPTVMCPLSEEDHFDPKYRDIRNWPKHTHKNAKPYKKKSMIWCDKGRYDTFSNILTALWAHRKEWRSVETGVMWEDNWLLAPKGVIPKEPGSPIGGHAVKIMSRLKMINGEPHLVIQNSYGEDVGDKGLFYMSREVVNRKLTYGAFQFQDLDPEEVRTKFKQLKQGDQKMESKPALQSQTITGAMKIIVPVIVMILGYLGLQITPEESGAVIENGEKIVMSGLAIWGLYDVIRGRWKAEKPLKGMF